MQPEDFFLRLKTYANKPALVYDYQFYTYHSICEKIQEYIHFFDKKLNSGDVVQLVSEYTAETIAILVALLIKRVVISPITRATATIIDEHAKIIQANFQIIVDNTQSVKFKQLQVTGCDYKLLQWLKQEKCPGLIIMTSGSTGKSKAIVHNMLPLLSKLKQTKRTYSVISTLLFDHIGGINSLLNSLYSGNNFVIPNKKIPEVIIATIKACQVDVLITTPSFLNLMYINEVFKKNSLKELLQINYSGEVMPESLLTQLSTMFPHIKFTQSYGLSELGILNAHSQKSSSSKIKLDKQNVQYRVYDGKLEIKSTTAMLGYLNAPDQFTPDGWFRTEDLVEIEGEYLRILGRDSDVINVGGEKVFPTEVENVLLRMPEVADIVVFGLPNAILGNIVTAKVHLNEKLNLSEFIKRMHIFCHDYLPSFKIPQKIILMDNLDYLPRFKKVRAVIECQSEEQ
ncbi:MAG: ANL family adenylate-forming protein [Gammaproteobacteria bacterium]